VDLDLQEDLMPLDPPAPSTPPTDPSPSTPPPSAPPPPAPPDLHCEVVWRQTFLAQFTNPADRDALQRFGDLLYTGTLEAGRIGGGDRLFAAEELDAVADDLDQLAATLREISEAPEHGGIGPEDRELCGEAEDWEGRLADLAHEIRCRVREVEGGTGTTPAVVSDDDDVPLSQEIRDSRRIARRLADHHPDPEVRRIYRQLVEKAGGEHRGSRRSGPGRSPATGPR
jgi:hypothetical protein